MNKTEFIEKLSKELDTTKAEASKNFDAVIKCITHVMKDNDELRFTADIPHQKNTPINNYLKKSVNGLL